MAQTNSLGCEIREKCESQLEITGVWHLSRDTKKDREQAVSQVEEAMVHTVVSMCHMCTGMAVAKLQASLNKLEKCCSCSPWINAAI